MKIVLRLVLLAALVALGIWLWSVWFPGPETVIRQRLAKLARTASFAPGEGNLAKLAAVENVASYFATNVEVDINVPGRVQHTLLGRAEIRQAALGARERLRGLQVKIPDVTVTVAPDKQSAVADLTIEVQIVGENDTVVQEMKFTFQKTEDGWLIRRVETVRTLS
jgi:hypothetical protein